MNQQEHHDQDYLALLAPSNILLISGWLWQNKSHRKCKLNVNVEYSTINKSALIEIIKWPTNSLSYAPADNRRRWALGRPSRWQTQLRAGPGSATLCRSSSQWTIQWQFSPKRTASVPGHRRRCWAPSGGGCLSPARRTGGSGVLPPKQTQKIFLYPKILGPKF